MIDVERAIEDGAWAWWNKAAVRRIRRNCDPSRREVYVYLALCEIASNRQSNNFRATLEEIGGLCGIHHRGTLGEAIRQLEFFGLVAVERSKLKTASAFKLLACPTDDVQ